MMQKVYRTLLKAVPEDARAQLDDLAPRSGPDEFAAGERLRAVAAKKRPAYPPAPRGSFMIMGKPG